MAKNIVKSKIKKPDLSVVMSVYNGEKYLREAVESILNQTFKNFEFIIIDDGSTDTTLKILKSYKDPRIVLISRENKGLVASLNEGIKKAKGEYIARQDADDISKKQRLKAQINIMKNFNNISMLGSSMDVINMQGKYLHTHHLLIDDPELRSELIIRSPFAHGSVMFKKEYAIKVGMYRQKYWPAEDYDLWLRLSKLGTLMNIYKPHYIYRENDYGISSSNEKKQKLQKRKIQKEAVRQIDTLVQDNLNLKKYYMLDDKLNVLNRIFNNYKDILDKHKNVLKQNKLRVCNNIIRSLRLVLFAMKLKRQLAS